MKFRDESKVCWMLCWTFSTVEKFSLIEAMNVYQLTVALASDGQKSPPNIKDAIMQKTIIADMTYILSYPVMDNMRPFHDDKTHSILLYI